MSKRDKIALIGAVATVATVLVGLLQWLVPRDKVAPQLPHGDTSAISSPRTAVEPPSSPQHPGVGKSVSSQRTRPQPSKAGPRAEAIKPQFPLEFTLADTEQKVLLGGQASLGIDFHVVDGIDMVTLTINASGSQPARHAIMSSGKRVEFSLGARSYYVYLREIDWSAMTARLRVDQKRNQ